MKIEDILVPVDFSSRSRQALEFAIRLMEGEGEIHLLHVVDSQFVEHAAEQELGERAELAERLTQRAEAQLGELAKAFSSSEITLQPVVVVGKPFMEIVRLAKDLDFQMIVMGTHGRHLDSIEQALFGSTAERVLRAANIPVVFIPYSPSEAE